MFREIERVGFAGLGAMGAGIAQRLLDAGYTVVGWNRTKEKAQPLLDAGMGWADTPRELAESVDVLFTMLTNTAAIEATADGPDGVLAGLGGGVVWADISTIAPDASVALAERVRATGAAFLDCPVSGSPATLAAGQMSVMVGGDRAPLLVNDTDVFADVELQQKDLVLAQELARRLGMAVPTCAATSEMLNAARSSKRADRDFVVSVHDAYRRMGGLE